MSVNIPEVIARLPLFSDVDAAARAAMAAGARERRLAKGEVLFRKGDLVCGFYVVLYGQIKLAFPSRHGSEKVVDIRGMHQSFGEAVMFLDRPYPVYAEALTESLVLHIAREPLFALIDREPLFARRMLAGLSMQLHARVQDVESYSLRSSAERLIGFLLQSADAQAGGEAAGRAEIDLPASKQIIASRLNVKPETLSRVQHNLVVAGLISVRGRHYVIHDVERLRRYRP